MSPQAGLVLVSEIVPRLKSAIPNSVCFVGSEDTEKLVQDATAIAAKLLHSVEARRKTVTPGNICYYAVKLTRQGRRSTGERKNNPLDPIAQLNGRCSVVSLDAPATNENDCGESLCLHEVLASKTEDPATAATRRLDWDTLLSFLDAMTRKVLRCLVRSPADGEQLQPG